MWCSRAMHTFAASRLYSITASAVSAAAIGLNNNANNNNRNRGRPGV